MHELESHINMCDTSNLSLLFYHAKVGKFSEVTRNLYRHIRDTIALEADVLVVDKLAIEAFKRGEQVKYFVVEPFERRFTTTYLEQLLLILDLDPIVAKYVSVKEKSHDRVVCSLDHE